MKYTVNIINRAAAAVLLAAFLTPLFAFASEPGKDKLTEDQRILHVLNRLGFGPRPGDVQRVRSVGLQKYIEQQLNPAAIDDAAIEARVKRLEIFNMTTAELFRKYPQPGALLRQLEGRAMRQNASADQEAIPANDRRGDNAKLRAIYSEYKLKPAGQLIPQIVANRVLRAAYSEKQLQEVMVDFWQNHFNVYARKSAVKWFIPSYERDVLRKNALGNFKDLLVGTAQHPAMLFFLDNFQSVAPNSEPQGRNAGNGPLQRALKNGDLTPQMRERIKERQGLTDAELDQRIKRIRNNMQRAGQRMRRGLNENYARELMELHTMGVDSGYTQADIVEVAKAFTGWTISDPRGYRRSAAALIKGNDKGPAANMGDVESGEFYFNERQHDTGTKTVLGHKINEGGIKDGLKVIDILANHPATAKFIARKLSVKFVSDQPSDALVGRIASAFTKSKGDIKTTLRAIFTDKEFFAPENYRAKIKTPFELAVSSVRALGADTNASPAFVAMLNKLGEIPYGYQAPTGYPDTAEDWVNTGALLERLNFAVAIASNRIPGTRVDLRQYSSKDRAGILDRAISEILNGEISPATRATLKNQFAQPLPEVKAGEEADADETDGDGPRQGRMNRQARLLPPSGDPEAFKAVSLVLGTPEFQRQ